MIQTINLIKESHRWLLKKETVTVWIWKILVYYNNAI